MAPDPSFPENLSGFDSRKTPILRTDVLVIGGGVAGASAALAAAETGAGVLLLSKTEFEETNTAYAQGGIAAVLGADDQIAIHLADTLRVGAGLADPQTAKQVVAGGPAAIAWLEGLGMCFDLTQEGHYQLSREGGHSANRVVHAHGDATGLEMQRTLAAALRRHPGITCETNAFVRDLLVHEQRCVGAVAHVGNLELGIEAGAVILATGGSGQAYRETTNPIGACGDGMALAFRAGAEICDMEFVQFHPTTLYIAGASRFLISEVVRGAGAVLRDRNGVRFMEGVHPLADLAPRDVVSRAILDRMVRTGDTHVFLDLSTVRGNPHELFPSIARICSSFDIDIAKAPIPVRPGAHYFIGGVHAGGDGRSSLAGLFAVGETSASGLHGANRLASNSLLEGAVVGRKAGALAAVEALEHRAISLPRSVAAPHRLEPAPRLNLDDMLYSLKSLMWRQVGLLRDEAGLTDALERIGLWHHYLMRAGVVEREACELTNLLTVSALVASAGLAREESRGTHFRTDHPQRKDSIFCRHLSLARTAEGTISVRSGPLLAPTDPR